MTTFKILPVLALLLFVSSCDRNEQASPANTPLTRSYQLEYLQPGETLRALQSLGFEPSITIKADNEGNRIIATFPDQDIGNTIAELLKRIDIPHVNGPTRFIDLEFADANAAANQVARHFESADPTMNIVPDARTNRVFLAGTIEQIEQATAMLEEIDAKESP